MLLESLNIPLNQRFTSFFLTAIIMPTNDNIATRNDVNKLNLTIQKQVEKQTNNKTKQNKKQNKNKQTNKNPESLAEYGITQRRWNGNLKVSN